MITVNINSVDRSELIVWESLSVTQNINSQADSATFKIRKYGSRTFVPAFHDEIEIVDGADKIFAGRIIKVDEEVEGNNALVFTCQCSDYTFDLDKLLVSRTYEDQTVKEIIEDLLDSYAPDFDADNVSSDFVIDKIVFNQVSISACIKKLADMLRYDWDVDVNKSIHFFAKEENTAPFDLTDINGNYVYKTLKRSVDGSQVVNRVKVRGGEYDGDVFTDVITVSGNDSKSFKLPYRMANLTIKVDVGAGYVSKNVGIDFIDDFTTDDVLYNYQDQSFRFESALSAGNKIRFSGNPKVRVMAIAEDSASVDIYGKIEKIIIDSSIKSNTVARRRANAELYAYASAAVDARFYTYQSGLRSGMLINIQSDNRGNDDSLIIKSVNFKPIDPNTFGYQVECVSTKTYDLIDVLRKILEPEVQDIDESEVSEEIFTDTQEINITEEIEMVTPVEDEQIVTIEENILLNPVDPDDVVFVLGPYTPTGQDDIKRAGRLDISMKVY